MFDLGIVSRLCSRYTVNELSVLAESQTFLLFFFLIKVKSYMLLELEISLKLE